MHWVFGFSAAAATAAFVGYCIYFDRKRHADPMFKQKLKDSMIISNIGLLVSLLNLIPFKLRFIVFRMDLPMKTEKSYSSIKCTSKISWKITQAFRDFGYI